GAGERDGGVCGGVCERGGARGVQGVFGETGAVMDHQEVRGCGMADTIERQSAIERGEIGPHTTISGRRLKVCYGPEDTLEIDVVDDVGDPGRFPFTRGVHPDLYRGKLWTMRQFAGFGTARQTNERFKFLLSRGQTGLSTAFDLPTLMGRDSD